METHYLYFCIVVFLFIIVLNAWIDSKLAETIWINHAAELMLTFGAVSLLSNDWKEIAGYELAYFAIRWPLFDFLLNKFRKKEANYLSTITVHSALTDRILRYIPVNQYVVKVFFAIIVLVIDKYLLL